MKQRITIELPNEMAEDIAIVLIEDMFEDISEFMRQCVRLYFNERANNDEGSLINDFRHWNTVQMKINTHSDDDLLNMLTGSIMVERMERIARSEILKRLYLKTEK